MCLFRQYSHRQNLCHTNDWLRFVLGSLAAATMVALVLVAQFLAPTRDAAKPTTVLVLNARLPPELLATSVPGADQQGFIESHWRPLWLEVSAAQFALPRPKTDGVGVFSNILCWNAMVTEIVLTQLLTP